jgi:1-acyl-sn-glycerol-3-phosphate acyltransferase
MSLRRFRRAVALGLALALCLLRLLLARLRGPLTLKRRAQWMQTCGRIVSAGMGLRYEIHGRPPQTGLLVANHLSYLDIVILGTALPCCMVSKAEIGRWPLFGMMARAGGTLFVERSSRVSAETVTEQVAERLRGPVPVLFFPEGTSTDGSQLLRFHSRLFDPAVVAGAPVTTATIRYVIEDSTPERELCWYGDALFLPHLWKALGTGGFTAEVYFGEPRVYTDRRAAADSTYAEIAAARAEDPCLEAQGVI